MTTHQTITTSPFGTVIVVRFRNHSRDAEVIWVCADREAAEDSLAQIADDQNLELIEVVDAIVRGSRW